MNTLLRWGKFNLVGAIGMVVQLTALALFNRASGGHYLYASAAAIEITLLHNFAWHMHFTWRDRCDRTTWLGRCARFHLSNGVVSMFGNLILMRLLVQEMHLPILASNLIAILCCSIINFTLGNSWVFAQEGKVLRSNARPIPSVSLLLLLFICAGQTSAQSQTPPTPQSPASTPDVIPEAPMPASEQPPAVQPAPRPAYHASPSDSYLYHAGVLCGGGVSGSRSAMRPTVGCGAGMILIPLPIFFEVGIMGPQANRSQVSGYISLDGSIPLRKSSTKFLPLVIVGYSRLFETGHALDYGIALALPRPGKPRDQSSSLRIELRDYCTFANPTQHNVMLRIGWMVEETD